jgi:hypothetical protein
MADGSGGRRRWWTAAAEDSWIFLRWRRRRQRTTAATDDDGERRMKVADKGGRQRLDFSSMATAVGAAAGVTGDENIFYRRGGSNANIILLSLVLYLGKAS